ncbi:hypothetical protein DPSP01_006321 [Paraphaeosphaeria sporulosa]
MADNEEEIDFGEIPERCPSGESFDGQDSLDDGSDFDPDDALADMEAANQDNDDGRSDADNNLTGNDNDNDNDNEGDDGDAANDLTGNDKDAPTAKPRLPRIGSGGIHISAPSTTKFANTAPKPHNGTNSAELEAGASGQSHLGYTGQWSDENRAVAYVCGTNWDISRYQEKERPANWPSKGWQCGEVVLKKGEPIRCKECGGRLLYKKRTDRMVQFEAR